MTLKCIAKIASEAGDDPHGGYQKAYVYIMKRDKEVARAFNDYRRSTAMNQLILMLEMKILSVDDLDGFSEELLAMLERYREE